MHNYMEIFIKTGTVRLVKDVLMLSSYGIEGQDGTDRRITIFKLCEAIGQSVRNYRTSRGERARAQQSLQSCLSTYASGFADGMEGAIAISWLTKEDISKIYMLAQNELTHA